MKLLRNIKSILALTVTLLLLVNSIAVAAVATGGTELLKLNLSKKSVVIDQVGASDFIDANATFKDGTSLNVTKENIWHSEDQDIAVAYDGRILAKGIGNTVVTVSYNGVTEKINVNVQGPRNRELKPPVIDRDKNIMISPLSLTPTERQVIVDTGYNMVALYWTPTSNLVGWRAEKTFNTNVLYRGIPYTQTDYQKDRNGFINALGNGDFYSYYERFGIRMPKYGNDCSAFVSFSMGLARKTTYDFIAEIQSGIYPKVGSYNASSPSYYELVNAYSSLQPGDAVVNNDHTFLISYNNPSNGSIQAYEQTPYNADYTYWGYAQMANGAYMPFSKK